MSSGGRDLRAGDSRIRRMSTQGRCLGALLALSGVALALAPAAHGDVGLRLETKVTRVGGTIRGWGFGSGMRVYLVPKRFAPIPRRCGANAICPPRVRRPPGRPYVLLGRLRWTRPVNRRQRFRFTVPRVRPGRYQVVLYCPPCYRGRGGSLILSGETLEGEVVRIVR